MATLPSPRRGRRWIQAFRERPETDERLATSKDRWALRNAPAFDTDTEASNGPLPSPPVGEGGSGRSVNARRRMRGPFAISDDG